MAQLTFQKIGYVGVIQVDRPEALNALNRDIIDALDVELDKIAADPEVRVLVIGGTPNFAAGADIKSMVECDPEGAKKFSFSPTYHKLMGEPLPEDVLHMHDIPDAKDGLVYEETVTNSDGNL